MRRLLDGGSLARAAIAVGRNVRKGVTFGLIIAAGLSLWALLLRVVGGAELFEDTTFSFTETVIAYFAAFIASGALLGLFLPVRRWAVGSMLLGVMFTLPAYAAFAFMYAGTTGAGSSWIGPSTIVAAVVVGGGLGLWVWSNEKRGR